MSNIFKSVKSITIDILCFQKVLTEMAGEGCKLFVYGVAQNTPKVVVVVVYHVTTVAIGHGLLKKFWPLVLGCVLRTAGSSII